MTFGFMPYVPQPYIPPMPSVHMVGTSPSYYGYGGGYNGGYNYGQMPMQTAYMPSMAYNPMPAPSYSYGYPGYYPMAPAMPMMPPQQPISYPTYQQPYAAPQWPTPPVPTGFDAGDQFSKPMSHNDSVTGQLTRITEEHATSGLEGFIRGAYIAAIPSLIAAGATMLTTLNRGAGLFSALKQSGLVLGIIVGLGGSAGALWSVRKHFQRWFSGKKEPIQESRRLMPIQS